MAAKQIDLGATGETVRANILRLRESANLTYAELSRRVTDAGSAIPPLGLRRIEAGQRRVDVDELVALAQVLQVSPVALLLPAVNESNTTVAATGFNKVTARELWNWLRDGVPPGDINLDAFIRSWPTWVYTEHSEENTDAIAQLAEVNERVQAQRWANIELPRGLPSRIKDH